MASVQNPQPVGKTFAENFTNENDHPFNPIVYDCSSQRAPGRYRYTSWWLSHPSEKYAQVKLDHLQFGGP